MGRYTTFHFVKFFNEERHADDFIKGRLFMRKLSFFKELEQKAIDDGRPDPMEGIAAWLQAKGLEITFKPPGSEEIKIGEQDLAAPVSFSFNYHDNLHVFCISALRVDVEALDKLASLEENQESALAGMKLDDRCLKSGPIAVVVPAKEFVERVRPSLEKSRCKSRMAYVEYYDPSSFSGRFNMDDVPFRKQSRFEYQKEYRICMDLGCDVSDTFVLEIGDMSRVAVKILAIDVNSSFKLKLERVHSR